MGRDWDVGSTGEHCYSLRCAHSLCSHILSPQLLQSQKQPWLAQRCTGGSNKWGLLSPGSQAKAASRGRAKETGVVPECRGRHRLEAAKRRNAGLETSLQQLSLRHLPSPETSLCWEIGKKDNGLLLRKVTSLLGSNYKTRAVAITILKANREAIEFSSPLISRAWGFCTQLNLSVNGLPTTTWSTSCSLEKTFPQSGS